MQNEPTAPLPRVSVVPFVALQTQQLQRFASRIQKIENEPNCQNGSCEGRVISPA
jgi:hypothetical protein